MGSASLEPSQSLIRRSIEVLEPGCCLELAVRSGLAMEDYSLKGVQVRYVLEDL